MNRPIIRLYGVVVLLFALLVAFTSRWTVFEASSLRENALNRRPLLEQERIPRGKILAADGSVLARSVRGAEGVYQRTYPDGSLFAHPVGYYYPEITDTGIERYRNGALDGLASSGLQSILNQLQGIKPEGDNVITTLVPSAQRVAAKALEGHHGAVVAIEPKSGAVTVMASSPGFDPNSLRSRGGIEALNSSSGAPLVNRAVSFGYPPGSSFKIVTATAAIDTGMFTPESTLSGRNGILVSGVPLDNDDDESFGQITLTKALALSVNTVYAQVAERLGRQTMQRYMERFGFDSKPQLDYPSEEMSASGEYGKNGLIPPSSEEVDLGRMGIGQDKLDVTALQMAEVASAVANEGKLMVPHLTKKIIDSEGRTVLSVAPRVQSVVMKPSTASAVTKMMVAVVTEGTGNPTAQIPGVQVAGKTGTAETEFADRPNNAWFIAFAPASDPRVAVAATLQDVPGFGATFAAPVAREVIESLLGEMIEPDTIIDGRYRVISRVGSGGMADVYLAQDQLLGREVAVKVLHHHFAEDHEFVERFRKEASSAAALSHPNIVGIFDRGEWNGTYYIAMEYVAGRSLKAIVREDGALEPALAIDIVIQILRAARFAHRRGVIHRDLKPHNVILDEEGRARVTDFGIARAGASDMTLTGSIMGTAQYLSPEQAQGFAVSDSSDLYLVGVILYELLTGVVPFEGDSAVAIAFKQVSIAPRPPGELNPAIPPSLDAVVMRALAKDPAERYASADELIAALQRERDALPAYTGAALAGAYETRPTVAAAPAPTAALAAAPLVAPPVYGAPAYPGPAEPLPPRDGGSRKRWIWLGLLALLLAAGAVAAVLLLGRSAATVHVPDVTGDSEQAASAALRRVDLVPAPTRESSTTVRLGLVIREQPAAGTSVKKRSRVNTVISSGPALKPMPNVANETPAEADRKLKAAGFKPVQKPEASATVPSGKVIGTQPAAGTERLQGTAVTVLVSSGPAPVDVPELSGDSRRGATSELESVGLALGTVTERESATATPGTVITQSPESGAMAKAGTKVDITLAKKPKVANVSVPTVVGMKEAPAEAALEHDGFTPEVEMVEATEAAQEGNVIRQSPTGATKAPKGSTVKIFVAVAGPNTPPAGTTTTETTSTTTPTSDLSPVPSQ